MSRKKKRATQDMEAMDGVRNQQGVQRASFFGTYLGAHEDHPAPAGGVFLTATVDGVLVHREAQREFRKQPAMPAQQLVYAPWSEVRDLEVDGTSTSKTELGGAVRTFGLYGLYSKNALQTRTTTSTTIVAKTTRGTISFQLSTVNTPAHIVRAQLAIYAPSDFGGQVVSAPAAPAAEVKDLLRQVAEAHQEGLLTDAEYAAKRAEIIRRI